MRTWRLSLLREQPPAVLGRLRRRRRRSRGRRARRRPARRPSSPTRSTSRSIAPLGVVDVELDARRRPARRGSRATCARACCPRASGPARRARSRRRRRATCAPLGREPVALAERAHDDRPAERLEHGARAAWRAPPPAVSPLTSTPPIRDALADLLGMRAVVRVDASRADEEQQADDGGDDDDTGTHGGRQMVGDAAAAENPCKSRWRSEAASVCTRPVSRTSGPDAGSAADERQSVSMPDQPPFPIARPRSSAPDCRPASSAPSPRWCWPAAASSPTARSRRSATPTAGPARPRRPRVARGFARSLSPRDLHDLGAPPRARRAPERRPPRPRRRRGRARGRRTRRSRRATTQRRRRAASLHVPARRRPRTRRSAVLRLRLRARRARRGARPPGGARCCSPASAPRCC